jgi:AcrR family transcriptional regulator
VIILRAKINGVNLRTVKRPSRRRKVGEHHGDLRPALVAAALAILDEGQAEALTLREVARRAGVSAAAPYNHFADKAALLAAVAVDGFEKLGAALAQEVGRGSDRERLARMAATYVRFASAHASHYRVMFGPSMLATDAAEPARIAAREAFERLAAAISRSNPNLSAGATTREALIAWALAHGAVDLITGGLLEGLGVGLDADGLARLVGAATTRLAVTAS